MWVGVVSLFPEMMRIISEQGVLARAIERGVRIIARVLALILMDHWWLFGFFLLRLHLRLILRGLRAATAAAEILRRSLEDSFQPILTCLRKSSGNENMMKRNTCV